MQDFVIALMLFDFRLTFCFVSGIRWFWGIMLFFFLLSGWLAFYWYLSVAY